MRPRIVRFTLSLALAVAAACGGEDGSAPSDLAVSSVVLSAPADSLLIAATMPLTLEVRDTAGQLTTAGRLVWSLSDTTIAKVSRTNARAAVLTALGGGDLRVVATVEGKADTVTIRLKPVVRLVPEFPSLFVGDTLQLGLELRDVTGALLPAAVTWSSRQPALAAVAGNVVTGMDDGIATLVAGSAGVAESVQVAVLRPRVGSNRELVYLGAANGLYRWQPGESAGTRITPATANVWDFAWEPAGSWLAYTDGDASRPGGIGVFRSNPDGSGEQRLWTGSGFSLAPSPDGQRLVFMTPLGTALQFVDASGNTAGAVQGTPEIGDPAWSPDGRQLAFTRGHGCEELWLSWADGTHARKVPLGLWPCFRIRWSPDGKLLAFEASFPGAEYHGVWLLRQDGSGLTPVSPNCTATQCVGRYVYLRGWSNDGSRLMMIASNVTFIWTRATGALDSIPGVVGSDWSPDGQRVSYAVTTRDSLGQLTTELGVMDPDGSNRIFVSGPSPISWPTWRP